MRAVSLGLLGLLALPAGAARESPDQPDPFARCAALFARAPERWESSRCFYEVARASGLWAAADRRLAALQADHPERPWLGLAAAYVAEELAPAQAAERYEAAVEAFAAQGHVEGEVQARCAWASCLAARGEMARAGEQIAAAIARAEAAGAAAPLAGALIFQARHQLRVETDLQIPYRLARRAEGLLFPRGPALQQMLCLELLASLARDLGRPDQAEIYYRRLEPLARGEGRLSLEAAAQLGLGQLLFDELDRAPRSGLERVVAQLHRALATAEAAGEPLRQARIHLLLGRLLEPSEADRHIARGRQLAAGRDGPLETALLLTAARRQLSADPAAAEALLAEAGAVAERSGDRATLARWWAERMKLSWQTRPGERAVAEARQALEAVEALRDGQLERTGRAGLFARWLAPYYVASGELLEAGPSAAQLDQAFAFAEAMRARLLLDLLAAPRAGGRAPALISRRTLEASLGPDEAMLAFQIAPRQDFFGFAGGSWLLVLTRGGTRVYRLPETVERAPLESAVAVLRGLIERRDGSEAELAAALAGQLLRPALAGLAPAVDHLIVVPDGALHLLPFGVLPAGGREGRYRLSVAPSATLWARWRREPRSPPRAALVLADPALPASVGETARLRSWGLPTGGRLPAADREGRRVLRSFGGAGRLQLGAAAGEAFLKRQDLARYGVLHLAAHAVADVARPDESAVLLAADGPGEDGLLQVPEIARLRLRGDLVVLSACRSAAGAVVAGEGVMSLARAFFEAGAGAVVGTLWPLLDDDAEAFFEHFYDHLAAGASAAEALAAAQRERRAAGAPAEAWAGFVLLGDGAWRLPPDPRPRRPPVRILATLGLLALGGLVIAGRAVHRARRPAR